MVKGFGRRPLAGSGRLARFEAGVRKPPKEETAFWKGAGAASRVYGDLGIGVCGLRRARSED
jgi:hypothetical protein